MIPAFIADRENRKRRGEFDHEQRVDASMGFVTGPDDLEDDEDEDDEVVLETKGSSPPPQASPMQEAQAQIELERARNALQQQEAERARAQEAAERQATIDRARSLQQQAFGAAQDYGSSQVQARGFDQGLVDQYGLLNLYNQSINNARLGIGETDMNPMASLNTTGNFNDALSTVLGTYRGDLRRQLNTTAPEDFMYNAFADSADDAILQSILDQGRADALAQVDAARARGQLNDVGYSRALTGLDTQGKAAMADLQDLGLGVLSGYRDQLGSLREDMLGRIDTADFSNPLDFTSFDSRLNQTRSDLGNRLEGDIFRATQGQSFFDPSTIISGSGAIQGFYNPTSTANKKSGGITGNPLLDAFTTTQEDPNKNKTATGNSGVF